MARQLKEKKKRITETEKRIFLRFLIVIFACAIPLILCFLYTKIYFESNDSYICRNVEITGCETLDPDLLKSWLGLDKPINLFEFSRSNLVERVVSNAPILSKVNVEIILPDTIKIKLQEREPIARLSQPYMMTDFEGVAFRYPRLMNGLPQIQGLEDLVPLAPGELLPTYSRSALHLIEATRIKDYSFKLAKVVINSDQPDDGLILVFQDRRKAKIVWPNCSSETTPNPVMSLQLTQLSSVVGASINNNKTYFNATIPNVVTASE